MTSTSSEPVVQLLSKSLHIATSGWVDAPPPTGKRTCALMLAILMALGILQTSAFSQTKPKTRVRVAGRQSSASRRAIVKPARSKPAAPGTEVTTNWTDKTGDGLWSTPGNWDNGVPNNGNGLIFDAHITNVHFVTQDIFAIINTLTIDGGGEDFLSDGIILEIDGNSFVDNGQLDLASTGSGTAKLSVVGNVTLSGGGFVNMTDEPTNLIGGSGTLINKLLLSGNGIQGSGSVGDGSLNLQNSGIINATGMNNPLIIIPSSSGVQNAGTLAGTTGQLRLGGGFFSNTNGTIQGNVLLLNGCDISGGTFGSGSQISTDTGASVSLQDVAIDGQYVTTGGSHTLLEGTITNNGTVSVQQNSSLGASLVTTMTGTGIIVLDGTSVLTGQAPFINKIPIRSSGGSVIDVSSFTNQSTISVQPSNTPAFILPGPNGFLNTGTVGGGGGVLDIGGSGGGIFTNFSGTTSGLITGQTQLSGGVAIEGGNLGGTIEAQQAIFDGTMAEVSSVGTVLILDGDVDEFRGIFNNNGTLRMEAMNCNTCPNATAKMNGSVNLIGPGTWNMESLNGFTGVIEGHAGNTVTDTLINNSTIQGTGIIGNNTMSLVNAAKGQIIANSTLPLTISMGSGNTFTNQGLLLVPGALLVITGRFKNFNPTNGTLTGGKYNISGTLQFDNANIVTNGANITLFGQIVDQNNANALANFANNTKTGVFNLTGSNFGANFTSAGPFTNAGQLTVGQQGWFVVGGSGTNYDQTGGTTTVDGKLQVSAGGVVNITGGTLQGGGKTLGAPSTLSGSVSLGNALGGAAATFVIGDSTKKTGMISIANDYTQHPTGVMDVQIGGTNPGTQYSQLNATGTATLSGTLNIKLINKFKPTLGQTFTILTAATALTGTFTTVNGTAINANEHFSLTYNPTSVVLTVVAGP